MNIFSIFTICNHSYKDAIDFSIPSWLKLQSVDKIYIYTDFEYEYNDERVIIINSIDKTDDWLKIVGLKAMILKEFITEYNPLNFVFIDIDCYITADISDVFDYDFDIAATRMHSKKSANSGVWFCKNTDAMKQFSEEWIKLQTEYRNRGKGTVKHRQSYSQLSFSEILHKQYKSKNGCLRVHPIDGQIYNSENDNINEWYKNVKKYNPKILHFKGRRWRDKKIVKNVL